MSNEIKEILDEMKFMQERKVKFYSLDIYQSKLLLDCITNLQEENKELMLELSGYRQAILNDDNLMGLKSRNDKAIEYIKEDMYGEPNELYGLVDGEHLLNILQSSDNNSK